MHHASGCLLTGKTGKPMNMGEWYCAWRLKLFPFSTHGIYGSCVPTCVMPRGVGNKPTHADSSKRCKKCLNVWFLGAVLASNLCATQLTCTSRTALEASRWTRKDVLAATGSGRQISLAPWPNLLCPLSTAFLTASLMWQLQLSLTQFMFQPGRFKKRSKHYKHQTCIILCDVACP